MPWISTRAKCQNASMTSISREHGEIRRMFRTRAWPLCLMISLHATASLSGQELQECEKPKDKTAIESFTVTFPAPFQRTYNATVETFVASGLIPNMNAPISNQIEWTSADQSSEYAYWKKVRTIRAVLFSVEGGTTVSISAHEETTKGNRSLSNKNKGYGFKVWCAARTLSDSLSAHAARLQATGGSSAEASHSTGDTPNPQAATWDQPPVASFSVGFAVLEDGGSSERVAEAIVRQGFLPADLLPQIGRTFLATDFATSSKEAVLLSDHLWRERYKAFQSVAGTTVKLGGQEAVIIGVLPPTFDLPTGVDLWVARQE